MMNIVHIVVAESYVNTSTQLVTVFVITAGAGFSPCSLGVGRQLHAVMFCAGVIGNTWFNG